MILVDYLGKFLKFGVNSLLNIGVWLIAFVAALSIASLVNTIVFAIANGILPETVIYIDHGGNLKEEFVAFFSLSFVLGAYIAIVPAILGSGVWEASGYQPPLIWQTSLGMATGSFPPLVFGGNGLFGVGFGLIFTFAAFVAAGAAGGLSFGLFRRSFFRNRRVF